MKLHFKMLRVMSALALSLTMAQPAHAAGGVTAFGYDFAPIGNATLTDSAGLLIVRNLGSSGNDGVSLDLQGRLPSLDSLLDVVLGSFSPSSWPSQGQYVLARFVGMVDGTPDQVFGTVRMESTGEVVR